jgi:alpha-L-fucosidase
MPLFIYYSIGIDWTHPYYIPRELYSVGRPHYAEPPEYFKYRQPADFERYREFCKQQLAELCTRYGPVAGFWFDTLGGVLANPEMFRMQEFYDVIHRHQPHALILFKTGATGTEDVLVGERKLESIAMHYGGKTAQDRQIRKLAGDAWEKNFNKQAEIAVTSQGTWEWSPASPCQDVDGLWNMLANAAANNANLLLNFGPKPDGSIPDDVAVNFRKLGQRIRKEGFPPLNTTTYLDLRRKGVAVDQRETEKTAR